ncbi:MAG: restriction endonuclease subunit S [Ruminococcus flavefaciens]|nr:restriction endonuclease subunit S [Ruminococcus flavefaciens]MCM1061726.1 restriction endonuclease subunit S [Eubacterium sp.]
MREMKDSGIEWIGKIPVTWNTIKNKYLFRLHSGEAISKEDLVDEGLYPVYGGGEKIGNYNSYNVSNKSFLIGRVGARCGCITPIDTFCWATDNALIADFPNMNKYYIYALIASDLNRLNESNAQPLITSTKVLNVSIPQPNSREQNIISAYLSKQCSEIDSLISDLQSQIKTLEEYKRSVITEAVTKGLDPDVEMRDSGIAWIGDIPKHWITHPLYFYFGERKNKNASGLETNLLSLSYGRIIRKDIYSNGGLLPESFNTYNIIEKNDIIIRPTDLQNDKRSLRTGIAREHGIITSAYIAMKAIKPLNPEYFHYLLHAYDVMKVFYNMGNGVRQGLNFSEFSRLIVFEPTVEEQNAIVSFLKDKCSEIDFTIAEKKQQIEIIEEYKKSLIFEYVTGKKEVI